MLETFGWCLDWLVPITEQEQELRWQEEKIDPGPMPVEDIWLDSDVSWGSLVGACVVSGYLVRFDVSGGHG